MLTTRTTLRTFAVLFLFQPSVATDISTVPENAPCQSCTGGTMLLQTARQTTLACPPSPKLDGQDLKTLISSTKGVLLVALNDMRCTLAAEGALNAKGVSFTQKSFKAILSSAGGGPPPYKSGASDIWDYLHCTYPDDKQNGAIMHSYVFLDGKFIGQGFAAAEKIEHGLLDSKMGVKSGQSCDERYPKQAEIAKGYMADSKNKVLLFGWLDCPCVGIAQARLAEKNVCYDGRTWKEPNAKLMLYFQCKEKDTQSHSFVYFRDGDGWSYAGNGFQLGTDKMTEKDLTSKLSTANAKKTCKHANVKTNLFGTQLEECQVDSSDASGSWMDDGTCSEQTGGIHQICIEALPADFSSETHQSPWSKDRKGKRHCVCVGAWSLYMTDAEKHADGAKSIMPHCSAIPETTLTTDYLAHWKDWNGYPAKVLKGVKELVSRCLTQAKDDKLKCGLKERFEKLTEKATELKNASELKEIRDTFSKLSCSKSMLLQTDNIASSSCA